MRMAHGANETWRRKPRCASSRPALARPQWAILLIPLATYPLIYYLVAYMFRYRIPINGILLMLAGAGLWHFIKRR